MSFKPQHPLIWMEIPVRDMNAGMEFYKAVFDYEFQVDDTGPNPVAFICAAEQEGVSGHLYPGTPAANGEGPTIHLSISGTVEEAAKRCTTAGGTVLGPVIEIPPGRFQYAKDPDGNSIGMFEPKAA